jgi:hypothetical protein
MRREDGTTFDVKVARFYLRTEVADERPARVRVRKS